MPDQLFGHALAGLRFVHARVCLCVFGMQGNPPGKVGNVRGSVVGTPWSLCMQCRFGNSLGELEEAVRLACSLGRRAAADRGAVLHIALKTLSMVGDAAHQPCRTEPPNCALLSHCQPPLMQAFSKHCKETSEQLACAAMSAVESHVPTLHMPPRVHVGKQQRQVCEREEDEPSHRPIAKLGTASDGKLAHSSELVRQTPASDVRLLHRWGASSVGRPTNVTGALSHLLPVVQM